MGALDALDTFLGQHLVEPAAGAAISVKAQNAAVAGTIGADLPAYGLA